MLQESFCDVTRFPIPLSLLFWQHLARPWLSPELLIRLTPEVSFKLQSKADFWNNSEISGFATASLCLYTTWETHSFPWVDHVELFLSQHLLVSLSHACFHSLIIAKQRKITIQQLKISRSMSTPVNSVCCMSESDPCFLNHKPSVFEPSGFAFISDGQIALLKGSMC